MRNFKNVCFLVVIITNLFYSQIEKTEKNRYIIDYLDKSEPQDEFLLEEIEQYRANPIYLENITKSNLVKLPLITYTEADLIVDYIENNKVRTKFELLELKEIPYDKMLYIMSFIKDGKSQSEYEESFFDGLEYSFRSRANHIPNRKDGENWKYYNRLTVANKNIKILALSQKNYWDQKYLEYHSLGLEIKNLANFSRIILGNYKFRFGKGLVINPSYTIFKDIQTFSRYYGTDASIYNSVDENNILTGFTAQYRIFPELNLDIFYSSKNINVKQDYFELYSGIDENYPSEYYDSKAENISEKFYGIALSGSPFRNFHASVLYSKLEYPKPVRVQEDYFYTLDYISFSSEYSDERVGINGEISFSGINYASSVSGEVNPYKYLAFFVGHRMITPYYYSTYANPAAEYSTQNERGTWFGIKYSSPLGVFYLLADKYMKNPSNETFFREERGNDYSLDYYSPKLGKARFNARLTFDKKKSNHQNETTRFSMISSVDVNEHYSTKIGLKLSNSRMNYDGFGWAIESTNIFAVSERLDFIISAYIFNIDNFGSRIYNYNYSLPGTFSIVSFYGEGRGINFLTKYSPFNGLNLSFNYSELFYIYNSVKTSSRHLAFQLDLML